MSENVRIALITAAAAVLGGLVAAGAGVMTTVVNQKNENERVEQRLEQEARGDARLLLSRFRVARDQARFIAANHRYLPFHAEDFAALSPRDLGLIDGRLSIDQFIDVDSALREMDEFTVESRERAGLRVGRFGQELLRTLVDKLDQGRLALLGIAGLPHYFKRVDQAARKFNEEFPEPGS